MRLIVEPWGEHLDFVIGEVRGLHEGYDTRVEVIEVDPPAIIIESPAPQILRRAGLIRRVSQHIASSNSIPRVELHLENYAVRVRRREKKMGPHSIEKILGRMIRGRVNLENPENIVRVYVGSKLHVGLQLYEIPAGEFEKRRAKNLPVSYPITMHPRLARFMVNLARVREGATILDPFCGTGTILMEAALMGMHVFGSDIDARMIEASRVNFRKFGISGEFHVMDVGDVNGSYDAIVTDPPYGRSASTRGEDVYHLYERAFKKFAELTHRVVIALPDRRALEIGEKYFELREVYPYRVHRSLMRYFAYLQT